MALTARTLGIPEVTVRTRLRRSLQRLRARLPRRLGPVGGSGILGGLFAHLGLERIGETAAAGTSKLAGGPQLASAILLKKTWNQAPLWVGGVVGMGLGAGLGVGGSAWLARGEEASETPASTLVPGGAQVEAAGPTPVEESAASPIAPGARTAPGPPLEGDAAGPEDASDFDARLLLLSSDLDQGRELHHMHAGEAASTQLHWLLEELRRYEERRLRDSGR